MQYRVNSPEEYFQTIDTDWRKEKILELREIIFEAAPEIHESIHYKMLAYGNEDHKVLHLNAQKHYVGLYVGTIDKIEGAREMLAGLDMGKGCIRIKKSNQIDDTGLRKFIEKTMEMWRAGEDTSC